MKLTKDGWLGRAGEWMSCKPCWTLGCVLLALALAAGEWAGAQAVSTTTVQGTVYLANGQVGSGTLTVSWPSFTTANGLAVAAGRTTVAIAPDGFVSVNLTPNVGALPAGLFYTAVFQMSDGTVNTEYRRGDATELFGVFDGAVYQFTAVIASGSFFRRRMEWMESGRCG